MIRRPKPERFRLRRTMMFMNAQKPGLIKDAYIYGCDSIMLDLEDAVAENQKDAARFSLYHALTTIDYGDTELRAMLEGDRRYNSDENYSDFGYQEQEFKNNELVSVDEPEENDDYTDQDEDPMDDDLFGDDPADGEDE